jgi:catechol 2,3-dioxygenase-like lactoylglutathione lyase family enzyme
MPIRKLGHYSIRTSRLAESTRFYIEVMGFREGYRPAFDFPGVWLYQGGDEADYGVVHLIGTTGEGAGLAAYLGERTNPERGTGVVDHLAFLANDVDEFRERLAGRGIDYRERTVPSLGLHQMFFEDPSGLTIEMNFPALEVEAQPASANAGYAG